MNYFELDDKELINLHKNKKINAITFLYYRYKKYSYAFIYKILSKTSYLNKLFEDKDAIIIDSLKSAIKSYDETKGEFKSIYIHIVRKETIKRIIEFQKNPLSDCISLTKSIPNSDGLTLMDVITDDKCLNPNQYTINQESKNNMDEYLKTISNERMRKIIELKFQGLNYIEISKVMNTSVQSVYALMYRFKKMIKENKKK